MDRREKTLARGCLLKSPVKKGRDKSSFSKFWNLRYCVFVQVEYVDANEFVEDVKLVIHYYRDEETYKRGEQAKGQLNVSKCKSIRNCVNQYAGFDHVFTLEFQDGKQVWLSAPSCEQKSRWIMLLYKHRFDQNIEILAKKIGIAGFPQKSNVQDGIPENKELPSQDVLEQHVARTSPPSLRKNSLRQSRDSGMFSLIDSLPDEAPPLPPRLYSNSSLCGSDINQNSGQVSEDQAQVIKELFQYCGVCQKTPIKKQRGSKKWVKSSGEMQEIKRSNSQRRSVAWDDDANSQGSNDSESIVPEFDDPRYTKITAKWLEDVKKMMAEKEGGNEHEMDTETADATGSEDSKVIPRVNSIGEALSESEISLQKEEDKEVKKEENIVEESGENEEEVYMDMSQCIQLVPEAVSQNQHGDDEKGDNLKTYFEMEF